MKVLIVEDNRPDRELLKTILETMFQREAKFREAPTLKDALAYLAQGDINCVLLDLSLPDSSGKDTFVRLARRYPDVPIIVMTNTKDRRLAIELVQQGAADYMIKDFTNEEDVFQRILLAIEKHKHTVRVRTEEATSVRRVERARANLLSAHESGEFMAIQTGTTETTAAMADLTSHMFTEIQKMSARGQVQGKTLDVMASDVARLKTETLEGSFDRPSLKSRTELLERNLAQMIENSKGETHEQADLVRKVEALGKDVEHLKVTETKSHQHKLAAMDSRTKIIVAVLGLLGILLGAAGTYTVNRLTAPKEKPPAAAPEKAVK